MRTYTLYTPHEGAFVINSYGATLGSEAVQVKAGAVFVSPLA